MENSTRYQRSLAMFERAQGALAGGVSSQFRAGGSPHPLFFDRAVGAHIWDVDGNEYVDYALSQGPLVLGHSHPEVVGRVAAEIGRGQLLGGQHVLEIELAERIRELVPCAELVRFSLSGTEANQTALRLARACTGRTRYVKFEGHYHGWLDNVMVSVHPSPADAGPREQPQRRIEAALMQRLFFLHHHVQQNNHQHKARNGNQQQPVHSHHRDE
jgi:glutamate-1-semialdehyde 2,1-aminomutase